jgi:hypothetical protein
MPRGTPDLSKAGKVAFTFEGPAGDSSTGLFKEYFATTAEAQAYATENGCTLLKKSQRQDTLGIVDSDGTVL